MSLERDGLARSVQVRLARHAKEIGVDPNLVAFLAPGCGPTPGRLSLPKNCMPWSSSACAIAG